jgi:hypothetical protein
VPIGGQDNLPPTPPPTVPTYPGGQQLTEQQIADQLQAQDLQNRRNVQNQLIQGGDATITSVDTVRPAPTDPGYQIPPGYPQQRPDGVMPQGSDLFGTVSTVIKGKIGN